jgi:hypothetical protein
MPTKTRRRSAARSPHLSRAMKAPRIRESEGVLADGARVEGWTHEQYLARWRPEEDHVAGLEEEVQLGQCAGRRPRPPGRVRHRPPLGQRLDAAQRAGRLDTELDRLRRSRCWSATRSATSHSPPKPPRCSTPWSPTATNARPSSSPRTSRSARGRRSSVTRSRWPPWSTGWCTTPRSSTSKATATGSKNAARSSPTNDQTVQNSTVVNRPGFDRR